MTNVVSCTRRLFFTVLLTVVAAGVSAAGPASEGVNAAVEWNAVATQAFLPTQGTDPLSQSRAYAMLHAAIHDALNAIHQRYEFYTPGYAHNPGCLAGCSGGRCRARRSGRAHPGPATAHPGSL